MLLLLVCLLCVLDEEEVVTFVLLGDLSRWCRDDEEKVFCLERDSDERDLERLACLRGGGDEAVDIFSSSTVAASSSSGSWCSSSSD